MSYHKHAFDPERKKAEAAMREREAIKDAAYESFELLKECLMALAPIGPGSAALCAKINAHLHKIVGGR